MSSSGLRLADEFDDDDDYDKDYFCEGKLGQYIKAFFRISPKPGMTWWSATKVAYTVQ